MAALLAFSTNSLLARSSTGSSQLQSLNSRLLSHPQEEVIVPKSSHRTEVDLDSVSLGNHHRIPVWSLRWFLCRLVELSRMVTGTRSYSGDYFLRDREHVRGHSSSICHSKMACFRHLYFGHLDLLLRRHVFE